MTMHSGDRSLGELFAALAHETGPLVLQEVQLAKTELASKVARVGSNVGLIGTGEDLLHAGRLTPIAALVIGLSVVVPLWGSALLIGVVAAASGYVLMRRGTGGLRAIDPVPRKTVATFKDDKVWVKEQLR